MAILFKSSKKLQASVDDYLDSVTQGVMVFNKAVKSYLENEKTKFADRLESIDKLESKADRLRRRIENDLYSHSLIPEHRGDVLQLLETIDDIIDTSKETLYLFSVEEPSFPKTIIEACKELGDISLQAAEHAVKASRTFFMDFQQVKDHLHKIYFYEKEADKVAEDIKRKIFQDKKLDLCQKMHLRYFVQHIDSIADEAENVADRLAIYTIKRSI